MFPNPRLAAGTVATDRFASWYVSEKSIATETCLSCGDSCTTVYEKATVGMLRKLYGEGT